MNIKQRFERAKDDEEFDYTELAEVVGMNRGAFVQRFSTARVRLGRLVRRPGERNEIRMIKKGPFLKFWAKQKPPSKKRASKTNGHEVIPAKQNLIPLDTIPGERPPKIEYMDTPGSRVKPQVIPAREADRIALARELVLTVASLVKPR